MNHNPNQPNQRKPRRAEPLQPDKPGSGNASQSDATSQDQVARRSVDRQREQSETALDNVRQGYE